MHDQKMKFRVFAVIILFLSSAFIWYLVQDDQAEQKKRGRKMEEKFSAARSSEFGFSGTHLDFHRIMAKARGPNKEALRAHTEMYYRYPPNSRPLTRAMDDLLNPRKLKGIRLPLLRDKDRKRLQNNEITEEDLPEPEYTYKFWGPKNAIMGNETMIVYLEVYGMGSNERIPLRIISASVLSDPKTGQKQLNAPIFNDSGTAPDEAGNDNVWTFSWNPAAQTREYWGELSLQVQFMLGEDMYVESQVFFSSPRIPAVFTGEYNEYLENGSLYIQPTLDVREPGHYIIEANLIHTESGEPMHWVYFNGELGAGIQSVPLQFFGKIFRENNREGVFELKNLRGYKNNIPFSIADLENIAKNPALADTTAEPDKIMIPDYNGSIKTKAYSLSNFSDDEYSSPDKEAAMAELEN